MPGLQLLEVLKSLGDFQESTVLARWRRISGSRMIEQRLFTLGAFLIPHATFG